MAGNLPKKIYAELTTRCNLKCRMCVKYAEGSCIGEEDLPLEAFRNIIPVLPQAEKLILNGIGEPLLHPALEEIIAMARDAMMPEGIIGFQSNGLLLDEDLADKLIGAGLSTICLSMDSLDKLQILTQQKEHAFHDVARAVDVLQQNKKMRQTGFRIGVETVLTRENVFQLPEMVSWAAENCIDYFIATHLMLYDKSSEAQNLFNPNNDEAVRIYKKYVKEATADGIEVEDCLAAYRKFIKSDKDFMAMRIFEKMQREANASDIRLHLPNLISHDRLAFKDITEIFAMAQQVADENGMDIFLPPLQALTDRLCPFMDEQATFIAVNGDVVPCHFLWHEYNCRVNGEDIHVLPRIFGNLHENTLAEIWLTDEYRRFREEAGQYNYAPCWSCPQGPCPALVNDSGEYANDCMGSNVPCGHCQWGLGGFRCL